MKLPREIEESIERQIGKVGATEYDHQLSVLYSAYRRCHDLERALRGLSQPGIEDYRIGYIIRQNTTGIRKFVNSEALLDDYLMGPDSSAQMIVYRVIEEHEYNPVICEEEEDEAP